MLSQACHAIGALALLAENRILIAAANGISILVKLLSMARPPPILAADAANDLVCASSVYRVPKDANEDLRVTEAVQEAALVAFTNLT